MMLTPFYTTQFNKDVKRDKKRGKNIEKLKAIMTLLIAAHPLPPKNKDHKLGGNFSDCRECHLEPDWLLIYQINGNEIVFIRTGSHSDLF